MKRLALRQTAIFGRLNAQAVSPLQVGLLAVRKCLLGRTQVFAAALLLAVVASATGCRSCQSCHDYDRPVANCQCGACSTSGCGRSGSNLTGTTGYTATVTEGPMLYEGSYEMMGE